MKVLVVEDTAVNLAMVSEYLEKLRHQPIHARNGQEAIEIFQNEKPDLVLMDIMMPVMDGLEAARRIRALESKGQWTPIILLTGMTAAEDVKMGIEAGGDDYIAKPVNPIILQAKLDAIQRISSSYRSLDEANQKLTRLSLEDSLTGIANRRKFDEVLDQEWRRMRRSANSLALIMIDVDFFKPYNDNYGHQTGDVVLKRIAAVLNKNLKRPGDLVARYGGEEFAIILPDTPLNGATHIAEHMRKAVEKLKIEHLYSKVGSFVTVSAGIAATLSYKNGINDLIKKADESLYAAKEQGRNRSHTQDINDLI